MVWHYTILDAFRSILRDGFIKPATQFVPPGERPVVWFSSNPVWENSAAKGVTEGGRRRTATFDEHVTVPIDEETELEMLLAAVQVAKGHHEYQSSESGVG